MYPLPEQLRSEYLLKAENIIRNSARFYGCPIDERALPECVYHRAHALWTADGYVEQPTTFTNHIAREQQFTATILQGSV